MKSTWLKSGFNKTQHNQAKTVCKRLHLIYNGVYQQLIKHIYQHQAAVASLIQAEDFYQIPQSDITDFNLVAQCHHASYFNGTFTFPSQNEHVWNISVLHSIWWIDGCTTPKGNISSFTMYTISFIYTTLKLISNTPSITSNTIS